MKAALVIREGKFGAGFVRKYPTDHAAWQRMLDDTEHLTLEPVEFDMWDLILDSVIEMIDDKLIEKAKTEYAKAYPGKESLVDSWLRRHKGKTIFYRKWEF